VKALLTANYEQEYLAQLSHYMDIHPTGFATGGTPLAEAALIRALAGIEIFIISYDELTRTVIRQSPDLKLIASIRGGPEANIDLDAATAAGIPVLYTIGRTEHAAAEYVMAFLMAMARPLHKADQQLRAGILMDRGSVPAGKDGDEDTSNTAERDVIWPLEPDTPAYQAHRRLFGTELFGKMLGIVGFGNIGQAVARLAQGFGMQVLVYDPYLDPQLITEVGGKPVELLTLMAEADYISLHARITPDSVGIIGRPELKAMKPTACLINTARAALVDEPALIEALQQGWFRMAGLDVHHQEPLPLDHPLFAIDPERVILSPHLAGSTEEVEQHHSRLLTPAIIGYLRGERPEAVANPAVFESVAFPEKGGLLFGAIT
jgi:phosphoglycerate dehydrogenase-like enzyme